MTWRATEVPARIRRDAVVAIAQGFEVVSIDLTDGSRRLEIQRPAELESEGLDVADVLDGVLHWIVRPASGQGNVLLHFTPTAPPGVMRLSARPSVLTPGRRTRVRFRATHAATVLLHGGAPSDG